MVRKASAVWHGIGRAGDGKLLSDSGVRDQRSILSRRVWRMKSAPTRKS
jgi:hypothetical protein